MNKFNICDVVKVVDDYERFNDQVFIVNTIQISSNGIIEYKVVKGDYFYWWFREENLVKVDA